VRRGPGSSEEHVNDYAEMKHGSNPPSVQLVLKRGKHFVLNFKDKYTEHKIRLHIRRFRDLLCNDACPLIDGPLVHGGEDKMKKQGPDEVIASLASDKHTFLSYLRE
jgi:hypothetical protein